MKIYSLQWIKHLWLNFKQKSVTEYSTIDSDNLEKQKLKNEYLLKLIRDDLRSSLLSSAYALNHLKKDLNEVEFSREIDINILDDVSVNLLKIHTYISDYTKFLLIQDNQYNAHLSEVSLQDLVKEVLQSLNVSLNVSIDSFEDRVYTDDQMLKLLLRNIIINANMYGCCNIWIECRKSVSGVCLSVSNDFVDNGQINIENFSKATQNPNYLPIPNDKFKLGLASLYMIAKFMNIKLSFSINPDKFTVTLDM